MTQAIWSGYGRPMLQIVLLVFLPAVLIGGSFGMLAFWMTVGVMVVVAAVLATATDIFES